MRFEIEHITYDASGLLGPAPRVLLWLHGCDRHCPGCIAADWNLRANPTMVLSVDTLYETIMAYGSLEGVTISGGEPFRQCDALAQLVAKLQREGIGVIIYTGYTLSQLREDGRKSILDTLTQCDTLIDGPYIREKDDGLPFRGSSNQVIHHFTSRYKEYFSSGGNRASVFQQDSEQLLLLGIPDENGRRQWNMMKRSLGVSSDTKTCK